MKTDHKITLDIPGELYAGIVDFKKKSHMRDSKSAVVELLKYALTLPPHFKNFDWKKAEKEASADIKSAKAKSLSNVNGFLAELKA
jgi:hypothetical protein